MSFSFFFFFFLKVHTKVYLLFYILACTGQQRQSGKSIEPPPLQPQWNLWFQSMSSIYFPAECFGTSYFKKWIYNFRVLEFYAYRKANTCSNLHFQPFFSAGPSFNNTVFFLAFLHFWVTRPLLLKLPGRSVVFASLKQTNNDGGGKKNVWR